MYDSRIFTKLLKNYKIDEGWNKYDCFEWYRYYVKNAQIK